MWLLDVATRAESTRIGPMALIPSPAAFESLNLRKRSKLKQESANSTRTQAIFRLPPQNPCFRRKERVSSYPRRLFVRLEMRKVDRNSHRSRARLVWVLLILAIFFAGYGLARASDRWHTGNIFSNPPTWKAGFPLAWKTALPAQPLEGCPDLCFPIHEISFSWFNFALDWTFFTGLGYALLAPFALRKKLLG